MAKVNAPLMSYDARGNLRKTIVFSFSRTNNIVKAYKKSDNPRSHAQTLQRGLYANAVDAWKLLSEEQKAVYNAKTGGKFLTGYNVFLSEFLLQSDYDTNFVFGYLLGVFGVPNVHLFEAVFMPEYLFSLLYE